MEETASQKNNKIKFTCPNCGDISQDDVIFLCNVCDRNELIQIDGVYMCPTCLKPGENFQCMLCDSKGVRMVQEHLHDHHKHKHPQAAVHPEK